MCFKEVDNYNEALEFVSECYKTQIVFDKAVDKHLTTISYVPECYNAIRIKKTVIKQFFYLILFPINIRLKKSVT